MCISYVNTNKRERGNWSVELMTPGEEVMGLIPAVATPTGWVVCHYNVTN